MTVLAIRTEQMPLCRCVARASRPCVSWASCPRFEDTHTRDTKRQGQDALATRPRSNGHAPHPRRPIDKAAQHGIMMSSWTTMGGDSGGASAPRPRSSLRRVGKVWETSRRDERTRHDHASIIDPADRLRRPGGRSGVGTGTGFPASAMPRAGCSRAREFRPHLGLWLSRRDVGSARESGRTRRPP
jgi:hypothetical protein